MMVHDDCSTVHADSSSESIRIAVDQAIYDRGGRLMIDEFVIDRIDDLSDPMLDYRGSIATSWRSPPRTASRSRNAGQSESGSGTVIASALRVGFGLRGAETSESRSPSVGPLSGRFSEPCAAAVSARTKMGPWSGHSYVRTSS